MLDTVGLDGSETGIAGLLEILQDRGGHEDLYRLAEESGMDVDDLLPIVEAAAMLGFATVHEAMS